MIYNSDWIEINSDGSGCFGGWTDFIRIYKSGAVRVISYTISDSASIESPLTSQKEMILRDFIIKGMSGKFRGLCTAEIEYHIETPDYQTWFIDDSCNSSDLIEQLISTSS